MLQEIGIEGAFIEPLKIISVKGGDVLRMLRSDSPWMSFFPNGIGEIYFSEVLSGEIKAWKMHTKQNGLFAVPVGKIKIVLYDYRVDSPTIGILKELQLGRPDDYKLLRIPVGVWYGFQAISSEPALICNCADIIHDPADALRLPFDDLTIPYKW